MTLRPEPMVRAVIAAPSGEAKVIIETLHSLETVHFNDFAESREGEFAEFHIGRPLAEATSHSEKLVRLRAMLRHLGLEGASTPKTFTIAEIESGLTAKLAEAENAITAAADEKARDEADLERLRDERTRLLPLASFPLNVEDFRDYASLAVFVGATSEVVSESEIAAASSEYGLLGGEGGFLALFVPLAAKDKVADVLFRKGFREHALPSGTGSVAERTRAIEAELAALAQKVASADARLAELRTKYGDFLLAAEEHLAIEVAKAEAPLSFAASEHAFVVDAWIPESEFDRVRAALTTATGGNVHVAATKPVEAHGEHEQGHAEQHGGDSLEANEPPTRMDNSDAVRPFQFFTELFSTPKWNEIDPTMVLAITFPVFFGFMIGDLGYGLLMAALGALIVVKLKRVDGARDLGIALLVSGIIAAAIGAVVFQDAFGVPFNGEGTSCYDFAVTNHETSWGCLLHPSGSTELVPWGPVWHKLTDVGDLLMLSIWVAFAHLSLGLVFGIVNEAGHSRKHAIAKASWLALLVGFFLLIASQSAIQSLSPGVAQPTASGLSFLLNSYVILGALVLGLVGLIASEGAISVLEIPSMLSNILSYTRLAGVAVAKGAMAVAFNSLTLVGMVQLGASPVLVVVGLVLLVVCQLIVFALGLISSGIQAIRLNYVEFFTKFYKGGGKRFEPFGSKRRFTTL